MKRFIIATALLAVVLSHEVYAYFSAYAEASVWIAFNVALDIATTAGLSTESESGGSPLLQETLIALEESIEETISASGQAIVASDG
jgi:hypothetical protein